MHLLHLDQWMARRKYLTLTIYISLSSLGFLLRTKLNGAGREKVQKRRNLEIIEDYISLKDGLIFKFQQIQEMFIGRIWEFHSLKRKLGYRFRGSLLLSCF